MLAVLEKRKKIVKYLVGRVDADLELRNTVSGCCFFAVHHLRVVDSLDRMRKTFVTTKTSASISKKRERKRTIGELVVIVLPQRNAGDILRL